MTTTNHQDYQLMHYVGNGVERLHFADKGPTINPFTVREGTTVEEVMSVVIDRLIYEEKFETIGRLKSALTLIENRRSNQAQPNSNPPLVTVANMEGREAGE